MGSITDVKGVFVGNFEDWENITGCSVIFFENGATASVDVRGGAPGTRETDLLNEGNLVEKINAIYIGGGSAFGLDGATGVMKFLEENNIGFDTGIKRVPIVSGAIIYDLDIGNPTYPTAQHGYTACKNLTKDFNKNGNVGAGVSATVGKVRGIKYAMKGGLGTSSKKIGDIVVGALVVVNALGDVYNFNGDILAGALNDTKDGFLNTFEYILKQSPKNIGFKNTTIGVIATNVNLTKGKLKRIAISSHDAIANRIKPSHTIFDGDTIFAVSTNEVIFEDLLTLEVMAQAVLEEAIVNAIKNAESLGGVLGYKTMHTKE